MAQRQAAIDHAFNQFVRDDGNSICAADVKSCYASSIHPKVISGECSEDEVFLDFLSNFTDKNNDGRLHRDCWNAYYSKISEGVPNDDHFVQLMCQVWRMWDSIIIQCCEKERERDLIVLIKRRFKNIHHQTHTHSYYSLSILHYFSVNSCFNQYN